MENYGKIIRSFVKFQCAMSAQDNNCVEQWKKDRNFQEFMNFRIVKLMAELVSSCDLDEVVMGGLFIDLRTLKVTLTLVFLEIFSDMYKVLNLREKLDIINDIDAKLLEEMRSGVDFKAILDIACRKSNASLLMEALNFSELSIYDKVLQIKALDEKDLEIIKSVYPLFEDEYNKYNVEVDEEFMIRQIKKWQTKAFKDDIERSYEDAAKFLDQYRALNSKLYERIMDNTQDVDLFDTKEMLKKFYKSNL